MADNTNITKKFRPHRFSEVIGQEVSIHILTKALESGTIPPAYLFFGIRGCGKTTCARLMAMSLNCQKRVGIEPCGECESCREILEGRSDYYLEIDGATYGKVESIRNIMQVIGYRVPEGSYRVVCLDECHALTAQAWQSSLKPIEEPPPRNLFVFNTTEVQKVIPTIVSRCVRVPFLGLPDSTVIEILRGIATKEKVEYEEDGLRLIAKHAGGSIRDAQSILEGFLRTGQIKALDIQRVYQVVDPNSIMTYINNVVAADTKTAVNTASAWIRVGHTPDQIIQGLLEHLRNLIMDFTTPDGTMKTLMKVQREKVGDARLVQWIDFFYDQMRYIREYPMEYSLVIDLITIKLIDSMTTRLESAPKRSKKETAAVAAPTPSAKPEAPAPEAAAVATPIPMPAAKLNMEAVGNLVNVCRGAFIECPADMRRVTIRNSVGTVFDVVVDPGAAKSTYYVLNSDLQQVIEGYPNSMNTYAHVKP